MDRRWLARLLLLVTGVAAGFLGTASFALGTCHSSGGFCADEFSSTHVTGYAGGALLLATATGLVAAALSLRLRAPWCRERSPAWPSLWRPPCWRCPDGEVP